MRKWPAQAHMATSWICSQAHPILRLVLALLSCRILLSGCHSPRRPPLGSSGDTGQADIWNVSAEEQTKELEPFSQEERTLSNGIKSSSDIWRIVLDPAYIIFNIPENPMDRGTWWATVHGVIKSQTQLSEHTHSEKSEIQYYHIVHSWKCSTWFQFLWSWRS